MIALSQFLSVLLSGIALIAMAVAIGGVVFRGLVLGDTRALPPLLETRSRRAVVAAAVTLALARLAALLVIPLTFIEEGGALPLAALFATTYAKATFAHAAAAIGLAFSVTVRGSARARSMLTFAAAALALVTGAWLTHASSRVDDAAELMLLTAVHQLGAAVWVGGIAQLALAWPLVRADSLWPRLLARFSPYALAAVLTLLAAGVYLATRYVGDWEALVGTGYGAMVLAKTTLLALALSLAWLNFSGVRTWRAKADAHAVEARVPAYVQAELAIVATALLTAASLTSQAPSADVLTERASPAEVLAFFAPKTPLLVPPPREAYLASAASISDPFAVPGAIERAQNNFNHNISGVLVLLIGIGAALDRTRKISAARHWPLLFLPLAVFVLLYAEPTVWPLGPEPFWATLVAPGVLQHRVAAVLVVGLAIGEWRVRVGGLASTRWRFAFPALCTIGGAMLLTHSHTVFATKSEFLIEFSHAVLGLLALMTGISRWLELRLPQPAAHRMGAACAACLVAVGLVLLFYREG